MKPNLQTKYRDSATRLKPRATAKPAEDTGAKFSAIVARLSRDIPGVAPKRFHRERMDGTPDANGCVLVFVGAQRSRR